MTFVGLALHKRYITGSESIWLPSRLGIPAERIVLACRFPVLSVVERCQFAMRRMVFSARSHSEADVVPCTPIEESSPQVGRGRGR